MRAMFAAAVACLSIISLSHADAARASIKKAISIPAQELVPALQVLSKEQHVHLVYLAEHLKNRRTAGAMGTLTTDETLTRILSGTGLTYRYIDEQTVGILPVALMPDAAGTSNRSSKPEHGTKASPSDVSGGKSGAADEGFRTRFRLAQAETPPPETPPHKRRTSAEGDESTASPPPRRNLEEVLVTAQKREERLQDVPIQISVLRGEELDRSTVLDMNEALSGVPGVAVTQNPFLGGSQVQVRGVATSAPHNSGGATIAYYLDGLPFSFVRNPHTPDINVYDLDRVEVLRGPQGTLYGASALNGVVRVLTRDANPNEFELKGRGLISNTEEGGGNYRGDMAVNVPIVEGKLAARAVVSYENWDGWIDRPNKKNSNDVERGNLRFKINAQPNEQLSIGLLAWLSRSDQSNLTLGNINNEHQLAADEPITADYDAYGLKIAYDLPWFSVTSNTSYIDYATDMGLRSGSDFSFFLQWDERAKTLAQEVLLTSRHGGSWRWSLGGMYRDSEDRFFQTIAGLLPAPAAWRDSSNSYALFGELTRLFLDGRLELTGGLRYFQDDVGVRESSRFFPALPGQQLANADAKFSATTPRLVLTWHPNQQSTVYASYGEGYRSGAHQDPSLVALVPSVAAVEPDDLTNYEVGAKTSLLDGRLDFETAVYYIDWQGAQQRFSVFVPELEQSFSGLLNGESASGMGVDFGMTARPVDRLELGINFNWNDLSWDTDVFVAGIPLFDKGDRTNMSPEYVIGGSARYVFPFGRNGFQGWFSASANYTSKQPRKEVRQGTLFDMTGDPLLIARTSVSLDAPNHWTATLFVDNVNNEQGVPLNLGVLTDGRFRDNSFRLRPRTIGVQFEYHY